MKNILFSILILSIISVSLTGIAFAQPININSIKNSNPIGICMFLNQTLVDHPVQNSAWIQNSTSNNMTIIGYKESLSAPYQQLFEAHTIFKVGTPTGLYQPFPEYERDIHAVQVGMGMDDIHWLPIEDWIFIPKGSMLNIGVEGVTVKLGYIQVCGAVELIYQ